MVTGVVLEFTVQPDQSRALGSGWSDVFGAIPELPKPHQRWTVRRKAAVIVAVRGCWIPIEEACELYDISVDEFLAWERDLDRYGVPGLRSTRYQIYRDTSGTHDAESLARASDIPPRLPNFQSAT